MVGALGGIGQLRTVAVLTGIFVAAVAIVILLSGAVQVTAAPQDPLAPIRPALNALAILVFVGAFFGILIAARGEDSAYAGGLLLSAIAIPFLAAILTIAAYLFRGTRVGAIEEVERYGAIAIGLGASAGVWLIAAFALRSSVSVDRANSSLYFALTERRDRLRGWIEAWCPACRCHPALQGRVADPTDQTKASDPIPGGTVPVGTRLFLLSLAVLGILHLRTPGTQASSRPDDRPVLKASTGTGSVDGPNKQDDPSGSACAIAHMHLAALDAELGAPGAEATRAATRAATGTPWVTGSGYVGLWARVHRAEEALMAIAPRHQLVRWGIDDDLRLQGAVVPNGPALHDKLLAAMRQLAADGYISSGAATNDSTTVASLQELSTDIAANTTIAAPVRAALKDSLDRASSNAQATADVAREVLRANGQGGSSPADEDARAALAEVRHSMNSYRDGIWSQMVEQRNRLIRMSFFTGITAYVLLALAIVAGVSASGLIAASAFYLVGAVIGLFGLLQGEQGRQAAATEDYGLSIAQLIHARLISGLAGVAGVAVTAALIGVYSGAADGTTPPASSPQATAVAVGAAEGDDADSASPSPDAAAGETGGQTPPGALDATVISESFDLGKHPFGLVIAAIFGLTPSLLINRLKKQSEEWTAQLNSTEPLGGTTAVM